MAVTIERLTEHFSLAEMTRSQAAARRGLDNTPGAKAVAALKDLCVKVLEPIRAHFARPVIVSSGFRAPAVNRAVGGAPGSQHELGEAADFTVPGVSNLDLAQWIMRNLRYDQLIYEFGESGWIHCSYRHGRLRMQEMSAVKRGGKTFYLTGIVA